MEEVISLMELNPNIFHVSSQNPVTGTMNLEVSILYFSNCYFSTCYISILTIISDPKQLPGVTALDLDVIKGKWYDDEGELQPDEFELSSTQASYSTKFITRFYSTFVFPGILLLSINFFKLLLMITDCNNCLMQITHQMQQEDINSHLSSC